MDNSVSKALIIVAGVLLAMVVAAFMTLSFNKIGQWASAQDDEILLEQTDKFNKEFEVYDKDLMYGVDVISCLNKAKSNNDAIVGTYSEKVDSSYEVKVKVTLLQNKKLQESMEVYHMKYDTSKKKYVEDKYYNGGPSSTIIGDAKFDFVEKNTLYYQNVTNFTKSTSLKTIEGQDCKIGSKVTEFNLTKDQNATGENEIRSLLSISSTMSEIVKNRGKNANKEDGWTKAVFKSALYDLKTRKFTCENLSYNAQTGRVNSISFKEIN